MFSEPSKTPRIVGVSQAMRNLELVLFHVFTCQKDMPRDFFHFQLVRGPVEEDEDDAVPQLTHEAEEDDHDRKKYKKKSQKLSTWYCLALLVYCLAIYMFVVYNDNRLPEPLTKSDAGANPEAFIEERARAHLKKLTSIGHRPAGNAETLTASVFPIRSLAFSLQGVTRTRFWPWTF